MSLQKRTVVINVDGEKTITVSEKTELDSGKSSFQFFLDEKSVTTRVFTLGRLELEYILLIVEKHLTGTCPSEYGTTTGSIRFTIKYESDKTNFTIERKKWCTEQLTWKNYPEQSGCLDLTKEALDRIKYEFF